MRQFSALTDLCLHGMLVSMIALLRLIGLPSGKKKISFPDFTLKNMYY